MPSLGVDLIAGNQVEILEPKRFSRSEGVRCDCCREIRAPQEFEQDCCGICMTCLECDDLLADLDGRAASTRPV